MIVWTDKGIEYAAHEYRREVRTVLMSTREYTQARIACACIGAACAWLGVLIGVML